MTEIVSNCASIVDWKNFVECLESKNPGIVKSGHPKRWVGITDDDPNFQVTPDMEKFVNDTATELDAAEYDYSGVLWKIYRVDEHFNKDVVDLLCKFFNIKLRMANAYCVMPGCNVPFHVDPQDGSDENIVRYTWQINNPSCSQALLVGNEALTNMQLGDVYQWDNHNMWHAACNAGFEPAYYFLLEGVKL